MKSLSKDQPRAVQSIDARRRRVVLASLCLGLLGGTLPGGRWAYAQESKVTGTSKEESGELTKILSKAFDGGDECTRARDHLRDRQKTLSDAAKAANVTKEALKSCAGEIDESADDLDENSCPAFAKEKASIRQKAMKEFSEDLRDAEEDISEVMSDLNELEARLNDKTAEIMEKGEEAQQKLAEERQNLEAESDNRVKDLETKISEMQQALQELNSKREEVLLGKKLTYDTYFTEMNKLEDRLSQCILNQRTKYLEAQAIKRSQGVNQAGGSGQVISRAAVASKSRLNKQLKQLRSMCRTMDNTANRESELKARLDSELKQRDLELKKIAGQLDSLAAEMKRMAQTEPDRIKKDIESRWALIFAQINKRMEALQREQTNALNASIKERGRLEQRLMAAQQRKIEIEQRRMESLSLGLSDGEDNNIIGAINALSDYSAAEEHVSQVCGSQGSRGAASDEGQQ